MARFKLEKTYEKLLLMSAGISFALMLLMAIFIFGEGYPIFTKVGFLNFISGMEWKPSGDKFGIFPMIVGTIVATLGALLVGVPFSILTAIFLAEYAPKKIAGVVNTAIELLAGIPSVIYGLFGMTTVVPAIRRIAASFVKDPEAMSGFSMLAAIIILSIMISPTIINISRDALKAVPRDIKEGSLALGATQWQTIESIILPAAKPGIMAGIILGMGRAIGETMAVIMVAGNAAKLPSSIFSPIRTLTSNIAIEMPYASAGSHMQALFGGGIILFIIIIVLNVLAIKVIAGGNSR